MINKAEMTELLYGYIPKVEKIRPTSYSTFVQLNDEIEELDEYLTDKMKERDLLKKNLAEKGICPECGEELDEFCLYKETKTTPAEYAYSCYNCGFKKE